MEEGGRQVLWIAGRESMRCLGKLRMCQYNELMCITIEIMIKWDCLRIRLKFLKSSLHTTVMCDDDIGVIGIQWKALACYIGNESVMLCFFALDLLSYWKIHKYN